MNTAQRILKFLAIGLAAVLTVVIFSAVAGVGVFLGRILGPGYESNDTVLSDVNLGEEVNMSDVQRLNVRVKTVRVKIVSTDESKLRVESNSDRIKAGKNGDTLTVEEEDFSLFENIAWGDDELVLYLPKSGHEFDTVNIETGAGKVDIERIETKELQLKMGAGKVEIQEVIARDRAEIDGGAGLLVINGGKLNNLDFDMGVGKVEITASILGSSKIDAGVGKLDLKLEGVERDYRIRVDKGLGSVKLNGQEMENERTYGGGENLIEISGGIGAIEIEVI